jgi:hypothetical protein
VRALLAMMIFGCATLPACGGSNANTAPTPVTNGLLSPSFPNIASFLATPSANFILDPTGLSLITQATPYQGTASSCPEPGPHTFFGPLPSGNAYTVDLYAPAAGIVSKVDTCANVGPGSSGGSFDRYGFNIQFAQFGGNGVDFVYTLEPFGTPDSTAFKFPCSGNVPNQDNGFYKQFLFVTVGQSVAAGQKVAQLYHPPNSQSVNRFAVMDWSLQKGPNLNGGGACANIFSPAVEAQFDAHINRTTCNNVTPPQVLCWAPGPGENIVGR